MPVAGSHADHAVLQALRAGLLRADLRALQDGAAHGVLRFGDARVDACLPAGRRAGAGQPA